MKTISREETITKTVTIYVAIDGTEFDNEKECQVYDNSAKAVINSKYNKLIVKKLCEDCFSKLGNEENIVDIVKVESSNDVDTVLMKMYMEKPYLQEKDYDYRKEEYEGYVNRALEEKDYLFINRGYCGEDNFWVMGTRNSFIEGLNNLVNTEESK